MLKNRNMHSIIAENIIKTYNKGKVQALDSVSLEIGKGELFGLIGPDGAGKSSLFRILTTLLKANGGKASVQGLDVINEYQQIRKIIGYMPGKFSLYQDLTVKENLEFFAALFNTSIVENYDLIQDIYIQLEPFKDRRAGKLSGGMKQKLALCCALIHKPEVLFLDEPTTGVDPVSRKEFWEMLKRLQKFEITIMVSTPYMDEADRCDRIALMQSGKILSVDTPANIIAQYPKKLYAVRSDNMFRMLNALRDLDTVNSCFGFGDYLHITMKQETSAEDTLADYLRSKDFSNIEIKQIMPQIEDCFMILMEKAA